MICADAQSPTDHQDEIPHTADDIRVLALACIAVADGAGDSAAETIGIRLLDIGSKLHRTSKALGVFKMHGRNIALGNEDAK